MNSEENSTKWYDRDWAFYLGISTGLIGITIVMIVRLFTS